MTAIIIFDASPSLALGMYGVMEENDFNIDIGSLIWKALFSGVVGAIFVAFAFGVVAKIASGFVITSFITVAIGWMAFVSLIVAGLVAGIVAQRTLKHELNVPALTWLALAMLFWLAIPFGISIGSFVYGVFLFIMPQAQMSVFSKVIQYLAPLLGLLTWTVLAAVFVKRSTAENSFKKSAKFFNIFALNALFGLAILTAASLGTTVLMLVGPSILLAKAWLSLYAMFMSPEKGQRRRFLLVLWVVPVTTFAALVVILGPEIYGFLLF